MKILHSFKYNIDAILKLTILLGFAIFLLLTLLTGKAALYVHPRIIPYIIFAIITMTLISIFIFKDVFKPQRRRVNWGSYVFFILPLIMAFTLPAKPMNSGSMSYDIKVDQQTAGTASSGSDISSSSMNNGSNTSNTTGNVADTSNNDLKLLGDTVVLEDKNFVRWLEVINSNQDYYEGKKIEVTGFVFKDKQFKETEFVPARLMMVCCAADLSPIGILCRYDKTSELKKDSWVKVAGIIKKSVFNGSDTVVIEADRVENTAKPTNEYVYPY